MTLSELNRRMNNLIAIGTITESKSAEGLSLARVKILDRVTDFLPVMQEASSFKASASPIKPGTQVIVLHPYGNADSGVIIGSIFNKGRKEPIGYTGDKEVTVYQDGTVVSYDAVSKVMEINAVGTINISAVNINVVGPVNIDGDLTVTGSISDSKGSLTGHVHTGVTPGGSNTGTRP